MRQIRQANRSSVLMGSTTKTVITKSVCALQYTYNRSISWIQLQIRTNCPALGRRKRWSPNIAQMLNEPPQDLVQTCLVCIPVKNQARFPNTGKQLKSGEGFLTPLNSSIYSIFSKAINKVKRKKKQIYIQKLYENGKPQDSGKSIRKDLLSNFGDTVSGTYRDNIGNNTTGYTTGFTEWGSFRAWIVYLYYVYLLLCFRDMRVFRVITTLFPV